MESEDFLDQMVVVPKGISRTEYLWDGKVRIVFDKVHATSDGVRAWVEVRWQANIPPPKLLMYGRFDLMSSRTVGSLSAGAERAISQKVPWRDLLTAVCYDMIRSHLEGEPPVRLSAVEVDANRKWVLRPLVGARGASSLMGAGGSLKSMVALAAAASVASGRTGFLGLKPQVTGPVLYIDYEAGPDEHASRLKALCDPLDVPVPDELWYAEERVPLWQSVATMEKRIADLGAVMVVVDSVMLARGPGDAFRPDETIKLYAALRQLGVPALLIDHKSREAIKKGEKGAFGSVVNDNTTRLAWDVARTEISNRNSTLRLSLGKHNNIGQLRDLAFEAFTTADRNDMLTEVKFRPVNPDVIAVMPADESREDTILSRLLLAGRLGMTTQELAGDLEKSEASIRAGLSRLRGDGKVEKVKSRWYSTRFEDQESTDDRAIPDPW